MKLDLDYITDHKIETLNPSLIMLYIFGGKKVFLLWAIYMHGSWKSFLLWAIYMHGSWKSFFHPIKGSYIKISFVGSQEEMEKKTKELDVKKHRILGSLTFMLHVEEP